MKVMIAIWFGIAAAAAFSAVSQPGDDDRRVLLEERRAFLAARIAEIDAELSGKVPPGTFAVLGEWREAREGRPVRAIREGMPERKPALDDETRDRLLDELAQSDPELAQRIRDTVRTRGGAHSPVFGRLSELSELRLRDPQAFAVRRDEIRAGLDVLRHSDALRELLSASADASQIDAAMERLRAAVTAAFDAKGAVLRIEIEGTEQHVTNMKAKLAGAEANRSQIIEQHFDRLVERIRRASRKQAASEGD